MSHVITVLATLRDGDVVAEYIDDQSAFSADARDTDGGGAEYMWTEGNYACDCNRRLFLSRCVPGYVAKETCGKTVELVSLRVVFDDGRRLTLIG